MRLDQNMFVPRLFFVNRNPCHNAVHPVPDRAVSVMIERIHFWSLKCSIRLDSVPSLPDSGGALCDRIKPRWIFSAVEQHVCLVEVAVIAQDLTEDRRAQEPG